MMTVQNDHLLGFLMASILSGYPDEDYPVAVRQLLDETNLDAQCDVGSDLWYALRDKVETSLATEDTINEVRSEYIAVFDVGKADNSLYETEYGKERALVKGNELADISGFYQAFGLQLNDSVSHREMLDHVSIELEFYALLLLKQKALAERSDREGVETVFDARKKFLLDHLGRFAHMIQTRPGVAESAYYKPVFSWIGQLVTRECEMLGVRPQSATWFASQASPESEVCCGGSALSKC